MENKMITEPSQSSQLSNNRLQVFKPNNIISIALEQTKNKQLTEFEFAKLMGFNQNEIKMLELYWNPVFNKSWIYLSDDLILENLTDEKNETSIRNFYNRILLKGDYIENIDYKEVKANDNIIKSHRSILNDENLNLKPGNRKKFYIVTGECYKCLLLSSRAKKGKEMRLYYIKVETLANYMKDYMFACFQKQKEYEIEIVLY
jgi:phage anti-repressor protein